MFCVKLDLIKSSGPREKSHIFEMYIDCRKYRKTDKKTVGQVEDKGDQLMSLPSRSGNFHFFFVLT